MKKIELRFEENGALARMVLNAPKANILDAEMISEATEAIRSAAGRAEVKLLVVTGAGDHFSFGASVEEHQAEPAKKMIPAFGRLFLTLLETGLPTLAAVRGQCLGGGMELAVACSWVFAHPSAKFGQPEIRLGVFPPVAALILPEIAGQAVADDICLTGRTLSAQEAKEARLVHTVAESLDDAVLTHFRTNLAPHSAASLRIALLASRYGLRDRFLTSWARMERLYLDELMSTHDANEGIGAFLQRRAPNWLHR